jgi:hypothetical protein
VWTGFLLLPFAPFFGPRDAPYHPERKFQFLFFTINLFLIGFYYLHSLVLIPRLLAGKKVALYTISLIALLAFFLFLPYFYFHIVGFPPPRFSGRMPPPPNPEHRHIFARRWLPFSFPGSTLLFFLILVISGGLKIISQWLRTEKRNEEIEKEKISTELSLLKSQVNPHFLFNTLNNIYSLAVTGSPDTAAAVMKLSSIMRYVLDEAKNNEVPLEKEIGFIENYIALQRMRLTDKANVRFVKEGDTENKEIAPLLLIAFVENAFKYGISAHQYSEINIALKAGNRHISFDVENRKMSKASPGDLPNTGIGLKNTRRRLELLYPGRHSLQITNGEEFFIIHLILNRS